MTLIDISSLRGLDAFVAAEAELVTRLTQLDAEAEGKSFNAEQAAEFEAISAGADAPTPGMLTQVRETIEQLKIRDAKVRSAVAAGDRRAETSASSVYSQFSAPKVPENIHDLSAYRKNVHSIDNLPQAYLDGAMRIVEKAQFPTSRDAALDRAHVEKLLAKHKDEGHGLIARRIIGTSDPVYQDAFAQYIAGGRDKVDARRMAVLQTYTDADGGYAIPFTIDPTFLLTNAGAACPFRQNNPKTGQPLARIETIVTKAWEPISTTGVTATYAASEVTAPTPTAITDITDLTTTPVRASAWVPFTAEYQEDYGAAAIVGEIGRMIGDAKDVLEASKFVVGTGANEPLGIYAALLTAVATVGVSSATFDLNALDAQEAKVGPRFRNSGRASHVANLVTLQNYRQLGVAGQPANSIYDPLSGTLHGYPAFEANYMPTWASGDESGYDIFGDFQQFVIVDRLGLAAEFVPQVFDGSGTPLGQRGVFARWRNTSNVLILAAFALAVRDAD